MTLKVDTLDCIKKPFTDRILLIISVNELYELKNIYFLSFFDVLNGLLSHSVEYIQRIENTKIEEREEMDSKEKK